MARIKLILEQKLIEVWQLPAYIYDDARIKPSKTDFLNDQLSQN